MINPTSVKSVEAMLDDLELELAHARVVFEIEIGKIVEQVAIELGYELAKYVNERAERNSI